MTTPDQDPPEPGARPQSPAVPLWPGHAPPSPPPPATSDDRTTQPQPANPTGGDTTVPQPSAPAWLRPPADPFVEPDPTIVAPASGAGSAAGGPGGGWHGGGGHGGGWHGGAGTPGVPARRSDQHAGQIPAPRSGPRPPAITGPPPARGGSSAIPPEQRIPGVNTMAIAALIFSILFAPAGIVMGHIAKGQIRRTGESGNGIATLALTISYAITLCACCLPVGVIIGLPLGI